MFASLLSTKRFAPLFWCQFFSALNDNFVKNALVILILFKIGGEGGASLVTLAGAALVAPFFFLSGLGGELADRFDKSQVAQKIKLAEIPIAFIAAAGFALQSVPFLFAALILYGCGAALFGPIKYGILPIHLEEKELSAGNALVEGATFIAILIGTIVGGLAASQTSAAWILATGVVILAGLGWLSAKMIPSTGAAAPDLKIAKNPLVSTFGLLRDLKSQSRLWVGGLITAWFWLVGAVSLSLLPPTIKDAVGGNEALVTSALLVFTVGIALGSAMAARASRRRPNLALVPLGAFFMGVFAFDLAYVTSTLPQPIASVDLTSFLQTVQGTRLFIDLAGLAAAGGLFIVPAFAAVQNWAPRDRKSRVVAACNILSALFMTVASLGFAALQSYNVPVSILWLIIGISNFVAVAAILYAWGREGVRDLAMFLYRLFLRLEIEGEEHLPPEGTPAVIAPNHVSLLDAGLMHAIMPSHASFAIDTGMAKKWWVRPFLKLVNAQPVDPTRPLGMRSLIKDVKDGQSLVIFPEGRLTVTGGLMKVYDGTAMIADKADAKIVPIRIEGPERSPHFGYMRKTQTKLTWFPKTKVTILPAVDLEVREDLKGRNRRQAAGAELQDVMVDTAFQTANIDQTLFEAVLEAKKTKDTGKPIISDPLGTELSYKKLIIGAQVLGKKFERFTDVGENVGIMLPNSAGVAVTFFALQTMGRVPAMLNFSAGAKNMRAACTAAQIKTVLTSRTFIEKARLEAVAENLAQHVELVYLEDIRATVSLTDKISGAMTAKRPLVKRKSTDPAAILFTSGSEGTPKGVVLSHRNILANAMQSLTRVAVNGEDKVFNVLPVFHSFGLTVGLVMPLIGGVPVYLYPSPLHYRIVPELVYQTNATIMFGTDTFLNGYARSAHPYDFARVRLVLAGAEAVKERTRKTYMDRFGVRILEGYGVTETAPVLSINTPLANKSGTVGRLSPLMEARLEPVPGIGEGGRLYVRGPNVMMGYLRTENPGVLEPPEDGWHDTGDIVEIDEQGFIAIKGRAKRFAKIAGEMVSLSAVEAMSAEVWPAIPSVVVSLPDDRKGERLILLTTSDACARKDLQAHAKRTGMSELTVPAEILVVDAIPLLGSGKPDYVSALRLAKEIKGFADVT